MPDYVRVVSLRKGSPCKARLDEMVVAIHRASRYLGNPEPMKNDSEAERLRVIEVFREILEKDLAVKGKIYQTLWKVAEYHVATGKPIALECWCAPKACHGDLLIPVIKRFVEEIKCQSKISSP